ncbi:hypothetical protein NX722_25300 [Endozoicomonas gorgoniicola]|uniref:Uncharacterized protein n=1 Tax=Endozoicomonas gorgoniicola TaxID=1234144 RepID=A0ABT3N3V8_9GAMM|nr:hypothetical protein [Endozoicomonas gorgoniicola]MCW7555884.1 hypothetical protein [Endozoicomonas gorgoniicola]
MNLDNVKPAYEQFRQLESQTAQCHERIQKMHDTLSLKQAELVDAENEFNDVYKKHQEQKLSSLVGEPHDEGQKKLTDHSDNLSRLRHQIAELKDDIALLQSGLKDSEPNSVYLNNQLKEAKAHYIGQLEAAIIDHYEASLALFCEENLKPMILLNMMASSNGVSLKRPGWRKKNISLMSVGDANWQICTGILSPKVDTPDVEAWQEAIVSELVSDDGDEEA